MTERTLPAAVVRTGTLCRREVVRFVTRPTTTVVPSLVTNGLFVTVFGVVLGARIGDVAGFSYLLFVLPGLMLLGTTTNAVQNSGFSVFHGRWEGYIDAVTSSPMSATEQVVAYVAASAVRGSAVGVGILLLGAAFAPVPLAHPLALAGFLLVVSVLFGGLGVLIGLWAADFDQLSLFNQFLLRPLVFVGGVFYPAGDLPPALRPLTTANPFFYMVNGYRYGLLGYAEVDPLGSFGVLLLTTAVVLVAAVSLVREGYGLRT
ncbi:MAG: ABC transporter permease [Haloferacaceae archaeon]